MKKERARKLNKILFTTFIILIALVIGFSLWNIVFAEPIKAFTIFGTKALL